MCENLKFYPKNLACKRLYLTDLSSQKKIKINIWLLLLLLFSDWKRRKANWICHILHTNCLLKDVIEGRIEETKRRGRRRKSGYLLILRKMELFKGSTRSHFVQHSIRKRLWTRRRQTTEWMNEWMNWQIIPTDSPTYRQKLGKSLNWMSFAWNSLLRISECWPIVWFWVFISLHCSFQNVSP